MKEEKRKKRKRKRKQEKLKQQKVDLTKLNDPEVFAIADKMEKEIDFYNLFKGEKGHADLFIEYNREIIKLNTNIGGYYFNQIYNLWEEKKKDDFFVRQVADFLDDHICHQINEIVADKTKTETVTELTKILRKVRGIKHAKNVFDFAKPLLTDNDFQTKLNNTQHLLPIRKGKVIDLKTLEVRLRTKKDLFSFEVDADFDPKKISTAEKFFSQLMNNNKEVVDYLQYNLGYMITGETNERCVYIFWGSGRNGKSTLVNVMKAVLNKLYTTVDKKVFIKAESNSSHTSHLIPLLGARLAVFSESDKSEKLNEPMIKALTGNDEISARQLYGTQFTFTPVAKYVILTNHKPTFDTTDLAMLDRVRYIPFNARFTTDPKKGEFKQDPELIDNLTTKYFNEVFSWLCIGANRYYKEKTVIIPKFITDATNDYIKEIDNVAQFIEDKCILKKESRVKQTILYENYRSYCQENGFTYIKNSEFYKRILNLGYEKKTKDGYPYIVGIEVNKYMD